MMFETTYEERGILMANVGGSDSVAVDECYFFLAGTEDIKKLLSLPLEDMPLYINDSEPGVAAFAAWRLEIAK